MRRKPRKISLLECYEILKIAKDATLDDVKHAYRLRAFELHPDLNPDDSLAGKKFQQLNEAYVALSALLEARQQESPKTGDKGEAKTEARSEAHDEKKEEEEKTDKEQTDEEQAQQKRREQADRAYAEQDVLRDLLNDPFARRVFEDIYRELNKQQAGKKAEKAEEPKSEQEPKKEQPKARAAKEKKPERRETSLHKDNLAWNTPAWEQQKGVGGFVKNWFKRQIDEEIHLTLPAQSLLPGRKVRLQIRHGIASDVHTIEVTLPKDFAIGKPVRLRGLGKHVGPWQGDLYLILESS